MEHAEPTSTVDDVATLPALRVSARAMKDLGFDDALQIVAGLCRTPFGREAVVDDIFTTDRQDLDVRLQAAMEGKAAVQRAVTPDFGGLREVRHILEASGKGVVLAALDIVDVAKTIDAMGRLKDVIEAQEDDAPTLVRLVDRVADERRFSRRVLRSFDESGGLVDDASPELSSRRARVRALRAEAQEKLLELVRDHDELGVLRDRNFTIRNDRYVLPVKSEYQGKVDGIVHDASQTHQTVFIEPRALLALGNRIKIARAEVIEEEQRILREMSEEIGELQERLASDLKVAGVIEAAFARGAFAAGIDGEAVTVDAKARTISLKRARHPLLAWLAHVAKREGRAASKVIPNELRLDGARCLVISGPNAGGKTVALKTMGLIGLLARAGIPVSVDAGSVIPSFAGVSVSIGDEQSLQGGFSSFSGHLAAVKGIVDDVDSDAARGPVLVLLDELMSGTDPAQGAALAQAVLEDLVTDKAKGTVSVVVTTHYDRLKALALFESGGEAEHKGQRHFRNASVGTDRDGRPTFMLILDEVGTSNAFDAARRFGMKEGTIERALALLAPEQKELHALLRSLAEQRQVLQARVDDALAEQARFQGESERLEKKLVEVDAERARLRREGKRAFLDELTAARQTVKEAIAQSQSKDAKVVNVAAQSLKKLEDTIHKELSEKLELSSSSLAPPSVKVGDTVELVSMPGVRLVVEAIDGDDVTLARGSMRTRAQRGNLRLPGETKAEKLEKLEKHAGKGESGRKKSGTRSVPSGAPVSPGPEPRTGDNSLDLRGMRADEAIELLEAFLDKLLRSNHLSGHVLHGHGGGSLKKAVREFVRQSRYVRASGPGGLDDGGDAWTVIELNPDARI